MKRLDIGWVTPRKKPKFALTTYSRFYSRLDSFCPTPLVMISAVMTNCEQVKLVNDGSADYQQSQHFGLKGTV